LKCNYDQSDNQPDPAFKKIEQLSLKFELLGEVAEELMTALRDDDDILMPNATHTRPIDAGFDREHLAGAKGRHCKAGFLVNFKTKSVTGSVKEPAPATAADARRIPTLGKEGFDLLMNPLPFETWPERLKGALLSSKARLPEVSLRLTGPPANDRAGQIPEIATARIAREDVQDDQLVCQERALSALVGIAGHLTASNDCVAPRLSSRAHHGEFHFDAQDLCRQSPPSPPQGAALARIRGSQDLMTARHTRLRDTKSRLESFHLLRRLELALRPKGPFRSLNANPLGFQTLGKSKRKISWRHNIPDTAPPQEFADYRGNTEFLLLPALEFLFQFRVTGDLIDSGLAPTAIELEIAQQQGGTPYRLNENESVRRSEASRIQHVRRTLTGSDDKSCWFHKI
jgi:hypothetical protein